MCRVGTWAKSVLLFQILTPTCPSQEVARNSPVPENARAVQGVSIRIASIRCPVGRSQTRTTQSFAAAIIHRPSFEKQKSLIPPLHPQNSLIVFLVTISTTRIDRSSQESAIKSLAAWY